MEGRLKDVAVEPQARLGLTFPGTNLKNYRRLGASGLGVVRIVVHWGLREPQPGRYNWAPIDKRVLSLQAGGIETFLTLESDAE